MWDVFLTSSKPTEVGTRTRLYFRALECGWFDRVCASDKDMPEAVLEELCRSDGFKTVVYSDPTADINLSGEDFYLQNRLLLTGRYQILSFSTGYLRQFCHPDILQYFGISEKDAKTLLLPDARQLYIRTTDDTIRVFRELADVSNGHPEWLKLGDGKNADIDGFIQNRGISSILGCILAKNPGIARIIRPNNDWLYTALGFSDIGPRSSECDIIQCGKAFDYKPFVMFVAGQELPPFERMYDDYTHFINLGDSDLHRMTDRTGENVHRLPGMAEQTGLYWIWKNVDLSHVKYIGFSTHRKPFFAPNNRLYECMENGASAIVNAYHQNRRKLHLQTFGEDLYADFIDTVGRHHPEFLDDFQKHEECGTFFPSNSFVVRTEDFRRLCEFVLPVSIDFAERHRDEVGKTGDRVPHAVPAGCMGEDLTSFYISKFLSSKLAAVPFAIYPKREEIFRGETRPYGMIFGDYNGKFYPSGMAPRVPRVLDVAKVEESSGFYPKSYVVPAFPGMIKSVGYPLGGSSNG